MGTFNKGILGGFSGKVGNVIGSNWKGKNVLRSLPVRSSKDATAAQLNQQEKFGLVMGFMSGMSPLLETSFKAYAKGVSGVNAAISFNLQNAISGIVSPFSINYAYALVSRGDLPNVLTATAVAETGNRVKYSWANNHGFGKAKGTDKAIVVVHCAALKQSIYLVGAAERSVLTQLIDASAFSGETVETWLAFMSANGSVVSNSFYTGSINIAP